jgi:hypothetical protein
MPIFFNTWGFFVFDVTGLQPEAQSIVHAASNVYLTYTSSWFIGLIAHGSAAKGGFIPGCSDIDLQLYLEDTAFSEQGQLPLAICMAIQRELAKIDPWPFHYIQCYALPPHAQPDKIGPIPGAYRIIAGMLPIPEATAEQLRESARRALTNLQPTLPYVHATLLEHGAGRLAQQVRFVCTDVWPILYHLLTLQQNDPIHMWNLPKEDAIEALPTASTLKQAILTFYHDVLTYYLGAHSVEQALAVFESAIAFLGEARSLADHFAR